ncbi:MAG: LUD domain-containing protein [Flavobacteriaceae bacterium]|nr:LUD domain-containing protein [Flavobacteriaceae bacterium]
MNIFRRIFGKKSKGLPEEIAAGRGKYMPEIKIPVDERFTINFKANGGKFLYCDNLDEIFYSLEQILLENNWDKEKVMVIDDRIKGLFKDYKLNITKKGSEAAYFLLTCENLIADDGSILISSNQIAEKKLTELPLNFVIYATTSQLVENIGEGLRIIKNKNKNKLPTNITTIKHFKNKEDKDFLSYGSSTKNLYLLLLEDL